MEEQSKEDSDALMEHLRRNPPRVKSIGEVVSLLHVISAEQRSCNDLRSCVDKVLMNMSNIRTLRDIIERLRSVSRTNGFRFELPTSATPETRCHLASDMFSVKIVLGTSNTLDHSPTVLDVSIKHKDDYRSSPHLANVIRAGNFVELSNHLKGLMEMYSTSGSRQSRTRVYMALQSLETDLVKMSQMYRETHKESSILDITMEGTVGCLTPRLAGDRPHFAYYISPYDLIDTSANCRISLKDNVPRNIGLHAEVSIEQRSLPCSLPISPLISNKHPIDSSGMPRFMDVSHHNSTSVQACFVLHLKPAVPLLNKLVDDIKRVTGLDLCSAENGNKRYLELINAEGSTYKVLMGEEAHVYHLDMSELRATLVNKVYFTQPGHVIKIVDVLRKQAHMNTLMSSCIRELNNVPKRGKEWYFEVCVSKDIEKINVTMEHPSSRGTALLEIQLDNSGFPSCKIFTGRGDPPLCADEFVVKVLRKCSSLPITMRKLIEQSIKNPKKESDIKRPRPLFPPPSVQAPTLLTPVPRPQFPSQRHTPSPYDSPFQGTMTDVFSPDQTPESKSANMPKKCVDNPMLTRLLIPSNSSSTEIPESVDQPIKSHPMLLTLLKDDNEQDGTQRGPKMGLPGQQMGMIGGNQHNQFNPSMNNTMGFMSPNSGYPNMDTQIPVPASHTMPPPSYPSPHYHNQFNQPGQMPPMSPAHVPHSPYPSHRSPMTGIDDVTGPVTPTNPFGMSPGLISPGIAQTQTMQRGRRVSRQKSHSTDNHEFSGFENMIPYETQMSMESDASISELLGMQMMQNRPGGGMTPQRRTDSLASEANTMSHIPLQHTTSLKTISESNSNPNLLTRSASVSSGKSMRSMTSPGPRNLRTPDGMMTLGSPPMLDSATANQRGPRVRSFDSDFFRSPLPSASPGGLGGLNLPFGSSGSIHEPETDPFTFDDNKNPSKISMPETSTAPGSRTPKASLTHSSSLDKDSENALRELAKSKPVLLRALTGEDPVIKTENKTSLQRQLGMMTPGLMGNLGSSMATTPSSSTATNIFDFPNKLMTSTSISTVNEKGLVRQNALDKPGTSTAQAKSGEIKTEKTIKRRNSNKNEEGKATAKKRGRPPSVKGDHGGKRKKGDGTQQHDDANSNPPIMLNIQLSSTGAPISSTTKTKALVGSTPPHKNPPSNNGANSGAASSAGPNPSSGLSVAAPLLGTNFGNDGLENYFKTQKELQLQKRKEMKEKKAVTKTLSSKQSFGSPALKSSSATSSKDTQLGVLLGKMGTGTAPRNVAGLPGPRKRKSSIKDVVDRLQSKISDGTPTNFPSSSSPDNTKQMVEKDANGNLLARTKPLLQSPPYQKIIPSTMMAKTPTKSGADDKSAKTTLGQKPAKVGAPKMASHVGNMSKGGFTPVSTAKSGRLSADMLPDPKATDTSGGLNEVLKKINEAAAASTKRNTGTAPLNKPTSAKIARSGPPVKARSITPTSITPGMNPGQRKSPSSQMLKAPSSELAGRTLPLKMASNPGVANPTMVKKSPMRNPSAGGLPSRPNSASPMDAPSAMIGKPSSGSASTAMISLSRKVQQSSGDQHFITPSISPTPKRTSSPQIQRTTSPLTRIDDKAKGLPGRPSPTHSRIATPVPASSPQSPDDRLIIDDPAMIAPVAALSRDDQRPLFIPGGRASAGQSPERTVMPSPLSPPSLAQKSSSSLLLQSSKRAPTPRSNIASPGMSPLAGSSPFFVDDDLMNEAVS